MSDWDLPKPWPDINQKTDVDGLALSKLQIGQNDPKEEQVNVTKLLIPLPTTNALEEMAEKTDDELTKVRNRHQQEEGKVCNVPQNIYRATEWRRGEGYRIRLFRKQLF